MEIIDDASQSEEAAQNSKDNNEVFVVPAFTGLGAPYWDSNVRGAVFGLTRGTTKNDFTKATLQSLAYESRDVIDTMHEDTKIDIPKLKVDGGAANNDYLMQFQADILGTEIEREANLETTALGAAFLAGLAINFWSGLDEIKKIQKVGKTFEPQMSDEEREHLYEGWKSAVKAAQSFSYKPYLKK